ncbi:unnamed protein product [Miscanthus lutarioriparius]|uniref:YABBY protein C-terminal domain-containing protein n=1 Tax=Miscanthus lutarioriparius TaxID=422564 RepID=A0A811N203_9POAL|nr:unnamed protein product [Miscanthus lutarioriparius]
MEQQFRRQQPGSALAILRPSYRFASPASLNLQENFKVQNITFTENYPEYAPSSSKYRMPTMLSAKGDLDHMLHVRAPEKRQRVPSAYNRFIKEEIRRIKASNPDISHREAFSTAAKHGPMKVATSLMKPSVQRAIPRKSKISTKTYIHIILCFPICLFVPNL